MAEIIGGLPWYGALVFWSLFCVVNPVGGAATLLVSTPSLSAAERARAVDRAVVISALILFLALGIGNTFIARVGIWTAGLRISGGLLLLSAVVVEWLRPPGEAFATRPITPFGYPLIASVSAVATTVLYSGEPHEQWRRGVTGICLVAVLVATWIALRSAERLVRFLGEPGVRYLSGIFKLTVAAWSVDFIATGVRDFLPLILHTPPAGAS